MELAVDPRIASFVKSTEKGNLSNSRDQKGLKQLCQDFEAILIHSLFKEMRQTIPDDGYLEPGQGTDWYQEIMDMEVARDMARKGGLGLAPLIYAEFQNAASADQK